mmetsp:Transcript_4081/g.11468  ORF Transcript_4081/g.11468 Transcript_4081/m.11468 type:complete len:487 (-) Transcript_4081:35-1495(-)
MVFSVQLAFLKIASVTLLSVSTADMSPDPTKGRYIVNLQQQEVPVLNSYDTISYKNVYFGDIHLGAPVPQKLTVTFDTGSGYIVVPSVDCHSETCNQHTQYDHRASNVATDVNIDGTVVSKKESRDQVKLTYGTGEIQGQFSRDQLCVESGQPAPVAETHVALEDRGEHDESHLLQSSSMLRRDGNSSVEPLQPNREMSMGCVSVFVVKALEMSAEPFDGFAFDGVLGLGLSSLSLAPECNFFLQMVKQGLLAEASFAIFFGRHEEQSEMVLGGHVEERMESPLVWVPVTMPELGHWQVKVDHIRIGNLTLPFCEDGTCRALFDSGTSILAVPSDILGVLEGELDSQIVDPSSIDDDFVTCDDATGPIVEFVMAGMTLSLGTGEYSRKTYPYDEEEEDGQAVEDAEVEGAKEEATEAAETQVGEQALTEDMIGSRCRPALMGMMLEPPLGPKLFILGEPVLAKYYTAYNIEREQVGFALAKHSRPA